MRLPVELGDDGTEAVDEVRRGGSGGFGITNRERGVTSARYSPYSAA